MNKDIYEIYRACRLCGVGAGYKMPIIQSIIDVDADETELKQKIRECVQIEVNLDDRMPPLICELCVDKILDYYDFRKMCQETNRNTRLRLGLPLQTIRNTLEPDSILGVTEPLNSDSDEAEPLSKQARRSRPKSARIKSEDDVQIKVENPPIILVESRSPSPELERRETRRKRPPSPKRVTRQNRTNETTFSELQDIELVKPSPRSRPGPKSMKKDRERQKEPEETIHDETENSLLVPRQKRPREVILEMPSAFKKTRLEPVKPEKGPKPGPKSSKEVPKPTPQKPLPKAGPKSRKLETSPALKSQTTLIPAPKSKKAEPQESTPKSKKSDLVAAAKTKPEGAKSKSKGDETPLPAPKAKKTEIFITPTPKTKKRDASSPAPRSKKLEASKAPEMASPLPQKASPLPQKASFLECNICGAKIKAISGMMSHMKTHTPNFTLAKFACNACELWFSNNEAANSHHRLHTTGLPYTCSKCYEYFRTADDYELHFSRNLCLPTYEVPDVKCEECWKLFPTYKLLEDHRCPGEGGRPGGKCDKCHRNFALLKSLTAHEMRCTVKKKVEPEVESESTREMLPMRVRIARCDALLTAQEGRFDVTGLPRKFGLDRNCAYPYLSTDVKPVPSSALQHMVAIKDEIKQEYLNRDENTDEDTVRSESDDESDNISQKSVDSLSTISLKTILSPKCLGPRKKRKGKSEFGSDSLNFNMKSNIDHIIDNLAKESSTSDNDSDSILDKSVERKADCVDLFDSMKNLINITNVNDESREINKHDEESNRTDNDNEKICNASENSEAANINRIEINNTNDQETENETTNIHVNDLDKATNGSQAIDDDIQEEFEKCSEDSKTTAYSDETTDDAVIQCRNSPKNGHIVTNKIVSKDESLTFDDKVENRNEQTDSHSMNVDEKDSEINSKDVSNVNSSGDEISKNRIENEPVPNNKEIDAHVDSKSSQISSQKDDMKFEKCEPQSHEFSDEINENGDSNSETNDNIDERNEKSDLPHTNDKSNEDEYLKNDEPNHVNPINDDTDLSSKADDFKNEENQNLVHPKESLITENELFDNENVQTVDKFNVNYLDDEDKLLMAELDAQIGENQPENDAICENSAVDASGSVIGGDSGVIGENSSVIGENSDGSGKNGDFKKYCPVGITGDSFSEDKSDTLDVLINKQSDLKSLDLDSISEEEFDFDI